jgi:hypothetical protein
MLRMIIGTHSSAPNPAIKKVRNPTTIAPIIPIIRLITPTTRSRIPAVTGIQAPPVAAAFGATLTPHLGHISVIGVVGAPHPGQKLVPLIGLAPQFIQNSGAPVNSLPQFLQNIVNLLKRLS